MTASAIDSLQAWALLPRRIYLDTSVLQTVYDFSEVIWEGTRFQPSGRAARVRGLGKEVDALRMILLVNQRAMLEFVVTNASLAEVQARGRLGYTRWVLDVQDAWLIQSTGRAAKATGQHAEFSKPRFGSISLKDRRLLQDAVDADSDAFLTMERRLPTAAHFVEREAGLWIMRPTTYWRLLASWAPLYC